MRDSILAVSVIMIIALLVFAGGGNCDCQEYEDWGMQVECKTKSDCSTKYPSPADYDCYTIPLLFTCKCLGGEPQECGPGTSGTCTNCCGDQGTDSNGNANKGMCLDDLTPAQKCCTDSNREYACEANEGCCGGACIPAGQNCCDGGSGGNFPCPGKCCGAYNMQFCSTTGQTIDGGNIGPWTPPSGSTQTQCCDNQGSDTTCDDGNACTTDACDANGNCMHTPKDCGPASSLCMVTGCSMSTGNCYEVPKTCEPGQSCNPATGACECSASSASANAAKGLEEVSCQPPLCCNRVDLTAVACGTPATCTQDGRTVVCGDGLYCPDNCFTCGFISAGKACIPNCVKPKYGVLVSNICECKEDCDISKCPNGCCGSKDICLKEYQICCPGGQVCGFPGMGGQAKCCPNSGGDNCIFIDQKCCSGGEVCDADQGCCGSEPCYALRDQLCCDNGGTYWKCSNQKNCGGTVGSCMG